MGRLRKLHYCNHCHKTFARAYILRDHLNSIRGIKLYSCEICSTPITRRDDLRKHQEQQHLAQPPRIACRIDTPEGFLGCDKVFKRHSDLLRHLRAPAGQFCRMNTISSTTTHSAIVFGCQSRGVPWQTQFASTHRVAAVNDPLSSTLLDQDLQINWHRCLLQIISSMVLDTITICSTNQTSRHTPQSYHDLIRITVYYSEKGLVDAVTSCARFLSISADVYGEDDVHSRYLDRRPKHNASGNVWWLRIEVEEVEYTCQTFVTVLDRIEAEVRLHWNRVARGTEQFSFDLQCLFSVVYTFSDLLFRGFTSAVLQGADTIIIADQVISLWERLINFEERLLSVVRIDHNSAMEVLSQIPDEVAVLKDLAQELCSDWKRLRKSIQQPNGSVAEEVF